MTAVVLALLAVTPVEIVVPDVRVIGGADPGQGALVAEEVARALPPGAFRATTAAQLSTALGLERQRQLLGCDDESTSCIAELANALGAEVVTQTTLAKVDNRLRCDIVFISAGSGASLERITAEAPDMGALLERLHDEVEAAAARILAKQRPGATLQAGRKGVRRYAWAPALLGAALVGTGAALFGVSANTWRNLNSRDGRVTDPQGLAESGRTTQNVAWALCSVGTAALVTSAAMFAFGAPTAPRVMVGPVATTSGAGVTIFGVLP